MDHEKLTPDYLFEVSWEVCNKVGGIHTVISTKARLIKELLGDRYILIGPDLIRSEEKIPGFIEDETLFTRWQHDIRSQGIKIKTGRWDIDGSPIVILIDFSTFYNKKNEIFGELWNKYRLDSITGQWDYIDPALFGYAAGAVIDSYYRFYLNATDKIVAQFHEWMTGAGILYLEKNAPQIATIFTTHATVLGRTISAAGSASTAVQPDIQAANYHVTAKHSLEKTAALNTDCFCCVSEITAQECKEYLKKSPDIITPNGFNPNPPPSAQQKQAIRHKLLSIAAAVLKENISTDSLLILSGGRYEFHNKGLDILIDAAGMLKKKMPPRQVIIFLFIPAGHTGPRNFSTNENGPFSRVLTHNLYDPAKDDICNRLLAHGLTNVDSSNIKIIFAPVYLDGKDGVFNYSYYDLLPVFDLAIFPSYYEPWGYTPMESLANGVYTITTDKAGFAQDVAKIPPEKREGIFIVHRSHTDDATATQEIADRIAHYLDLSIFQKAQLSANATAISRQYTWEQRIGQYKAAWSLALNRSHLREYLFYDKPATLPPEESAKVLSKPDWREINILSFPTEKVTQLYASNHLPTKNYPIIAYFCMEYGIHPALRIYAGGLGILAGDYLKTASDLNIPVIAVGLLYRHGYFKQQITDSGQQLMLTEQIDPTPLPLQEVKHQCGDTLLIKLNFPGRQIALKAWKAQVGNSILYLLDSDVIANHPDDQLITSCLYPSEKEYRLQQEIVLGIGGVRLLQELGHTVHVFHCNEGHAAFMTLERIRNIITTSHLSYSAAAEMVRSSQLFTTHTSATAAMDMYDETLLHTYLSHFAKECFISWDELFSSGTLNSQKEFSMFCLAAKNAHLINSVSKKHKEVTSHLLAPIWENHLDIDLPLLSVTNGVHLSSWMAGEWQEVFRNIGIDILTGEGSWEKLNALNDEQIWSVRLAIKKRFTDQLSTLLSEQYSRHHYAAEKLTNTLALIKQATMFIGFARRITHYKRPDLLYFDLERLTKVLEGKDHPVVLVIAGKAHPADIEGIKILEKIYSLTANPHIIFLEDYDIKIAQLLTQGVDCWLNLPIRNTEACGTSGMKALINGVLNLSTHDGWWAEYYTPDIGWTLTRNPVSGDDDAPEQHKADAEELYNLLEHFIIPLYFRREENGIPLTWTGMIRNAFVNIMPKISATRMMQEYQACYKKLYERTIALELNNYQQMKAIVAWKEKINCGWNSIKLIMATPEKGKLLSSKAGDVITTTITIDPGTLLPEDIGADVILTPRHDGNNQVIKKELLLRRNIAGNVTYSADIPLTSSGEYNLTFRLYPRNYLLPYKTAMPDIIWA